MEDCRIRSAACGMSRSPEREPRVSEQGERAKPSSHRRGARDGRGQGAARSRTRGGVAEHRGDRARARRARARRRAARRLLPRARGAAHRGRRRERGRRTEREPDAADARGHDRLAAALPEGHRQGRPAHRGAGGRAGEADRARRAPREAGDGRGQPAPRRLDRQEVPQPGPAVPRSDPGGDDRARARGREVRPPQGLQVLDLRDVVDPPGRRPRARRQGADDPDAGPRRREAEQDRPLGAEAARRARARADLARDRGSTSS